MYQVAVFVHFYFISPFLSQFYSSYPIVHMPPPFSSASLPSSETPLSSPYYSRSPHLPSLPLTPHAAPPSVPSLGTPQTPLSTPQHMPSLALPVPLLGLAKSPVVPQQQGGLPTSQPHFGSFHSTHPLLSQVQPTPFSAPHPEQELTEQPVQVNIWLSSHWNGSILRDLSC